MLQINTPLHDVIVDSRMVVLFEYESLLSLVGNWYRRDLKYGNNQMSTRRDNVVLFAILPYFTLSKFSLRELRHVAVAYKLYFVLHSCFWFKKGGSAFLEKQQCSRRRERISLPCI